jgi:hypothetical protein
MNYAYFKSKQGMLVGSCGWLLIGGFNLIFHTSPSQNWMWWTEIAVGVLLMGYAILRK